MDREKVIKEMIELKKYLPSTMWEPINNAWSLLKEQEAVKPYIDIDEAKCPICKVKLTRQELLGDDVLFEDFFDYCPHCGRSVKWEMSENDMDNTNRKEHDQERISVPEVEGDRWGWFYVCSECHGLIDWKDQVCPHCKARIDWNG